MAKPPARKRRKAKPALRPRVVKPAVQIDDGAAFCRAVEAATRRGKVPVLSELKLRRILTAVVKAYAAQTEDAGREIPPFLDNSVTATEAVVAACAIIRAVDLNLFDVAMWFRRPVAG